MGSQPGIIDKLERRELQLDVEVTALSQEKDEASKQRLKQIAETEHRITKENKQNQDRLLTEVVSPNAIAETGTKENERLSLD